MLTKTERHRFRDPDGFYRHEVLPTRVEVPILSIEYARRGDRLLPFSITTPCDTFDVEYCRSHDQLYFHSSGSGSYLPHREYHNGRVTTRGARRSRRFRQPRVRETSRQDTALEYFGKISFTPWGRLVGGELIPVWLNRKFVDVVSAQGIRVADPKVFLKWKGHELLDEPVPVDGKTNPFDLDDYRSHGDTQTTYCSECDDYLPELDYGLRLCDHVYWCDHCCWWTGPGANDQCQHGLHGLLALPDKWLRVMVTRQDAISAGVPKWEVRHAIGGYFSGAQRVSIRRAVRTAMEVGCEEFRESVDRVCRNKLVARKCPEIVK